MKKSFGLLVISLFLAAALVFGRADSVHAHEGGPFSEQSAGVVNTEDSGPNSYEFIAQEGDNLTILVRRSIQLYADAKNTSMAPSAILYCETNTVKQLGSKQIDVGEHVDVPFDVIQKYIVSSRELTKTQKDAWGIYEAQADFELWGVEPSNKAVAQQAATPRTSSTFTDNAASVETESSSASPSWPWLVMVVGVLAIAVYFILQRKAKYSPTKSKKGTIKRLWSPQAAPAVRQGRTKKGTVNTKNTRKRS